MPILIHYMKMLHYAIVVVCWCLVRVQATENSPSIIVVGSGAAGLAASIRFLENGFENVTILEAENRIGGRLYSIELGGYPIDVGAQWVHGEENNAVFEMVWPLGLIERSSEHGSPEIFSSSGVKMPEETVAALVEFYSNIVEVEAPKEYSNKSFGDWISDKLDEFFESNPNITTEQREPLKTILCLEQMSADSADSWFNLSMHSEYVVSKGDQLINWKDKTYAFFIDILLKKYPNSVEEIPVRSKTILNAEVSRINYENDDGVVRLVTSNGDEYVADHVIFTPSLGVLKSEHQTMFNPPLPEKKVQAIESYGYGSVAKVFLFYSEPWWPEEDYIINANLYYTEAEKNEIAKDPNKSWILSMYSVVGVEHKPGLLCCWLTGPYNREMESKSEEEVLHGVKEVLHRFLGKTYNLTEPTAMYRSQWYSNKHFKGTYSYRRPETDQTDSTTADLAEPIILKGTPRVLFAGEATSIQQHSTVHGAMSSGWREADRLLTFYNRLVIQNGTSLTS